MRLAVIMSLYKNDNKFFLLQSVESILNQTYKDFDFYIQCDGELKDDVIEYLNNLNDSRIFLRKRKNNKGLAYSLNELLQLILPEKKYEYIARMDADDISMLTRFEKQIEFLNKNKQIDSVGTWAVEIDENGREYYRKEMPVSHEGCLKLFKKRDCYIHPTVMFRVSYFEKTGLYPEDTYFGEDTMMWAKGFHNGCVFANIPEFLLNFRLDKNFFERRRGWSHAKSIFALRCRVNKLLEFSAKEYCYAFAYAFAKLMPRFILNFLYKKLR